MKLSDIIKVIAQELGASDPKEINKLLKAEPGTKFRITGLNLGHFGFTGLIKNISEEGVKVFMANKVSLIRLGDIETFEKAKTRAERPVRPLKVKDVKAKRTTAEDDIDDGVEAEEAPKSSKKGKSKSAGKSGSKFIPAFKK